MATLWKRKKKGGFVYMIDFYYGGKRIQRSAKTDDRQTAKLILKDIEARVAKGSFNIEDIKPRKKVFLNDFIKEYLSFSKSHKAYMTWMREKLVLKMFRNFAGNIPLAAIDRKLLDEYMQERIKSLSRASVNIDLRHMKAALTKAVEWQYLLKNPAKGIKPLSIPQNAPKFFTEQQMGLINQNIQAEHISQIVLFAVNTGVRIGELVNIRWQDIDLDKKTIRIAQTIEHQTKSKRERTIPMNTAVYNLIEGMERRGDYVFCRLDGRKRQCHYISWSFKKMLRKVGLEEQYSFHSLRHTFASQLVQKGVAIYHVSKLLGHSNIKTTEIYAHLAPENLHEVVKLLDHEL
ncbi:hypothetical protein BVY01_02910 [bacterium I07]|nr:hypothetical protein BVY01_02910 [bacterium I07]